MTPNLLFRLSGLFMSFFTFLRSVECFGKLSSNLGSFFEVFHTVRNAVFSLSPRRNWNWPIAGETRLPQGRGFSLRKKQLGELLAVLQLTFAVYSPLSRGCEDWPIWPT